MWQGSHEGGSCAPVHREAPCQRMPFIYARAELTESSLDVEMLFPCSILPLPTQHQVSCHHFLAPRMREMEISYGIAPLLSSVQRMVMPSQPDEYSLSSSKEQSAAGSGLTLSKGNSTVFFFWNIWLLIFCWHFTSFSSVVLISHLPGFTNLLFSAHDPIGFGKPLFYFLIHTWCLWNWKIKWPFLDTMSLEPNFIRSVGETWKHPLQTFWIDHLCFSQTRLISGKWLRKQWITIKYTVVLLWMLINNCQGHCTWVTGSSLKMQEMPGGGWS